jgi:hypothetical protein
MPRRNRTFGVRHLSDSERALADAIPLQVDCSCVRLYEAGCPGVAGGLRRLVLRASRNRAIALGNHVFLPDWYRGDLAVLAHELTHCGQYQIWGPLMYFARGAAAQLRDLLYRRLSIGSNPYQYRMVPGKPFRAYGMEQQAQIVEDSLRNRTYDQAMPSA